jgi:hypothetical protein
MMMMMMVIIRLQYVAEVPYIMASKNRLDAC